jgi:integrase
MSNIKRRDNKNRLLRRGESQLEDGRYKYRYQDKKTGNRGEVYSWRLVETDETPQGKRRDKSLREKEAEIEKDLIDNIDINGTKMTLNELFDRYIKKKRKLSASTKDNYLILYNAHIRGTYLGNMEIKSIIKDNVLALYCDIADEGISNGTIRLIHTSMLAPAFNYAVDNDWIKKPPTKGCLEDFPYDSTNRREALTVNEQNRFVEFLKNDKVYGKYLLIVRLILQTALRNGEALGLTWKDIDFEKRLININHQVNYKSQNGKYCFKAGEPKYGEKRIIPMTQEAYLVLKEVRERDYFNSVSSGIKINGFSNFVFLNQQKDNPIIPRQFSDALVMATNKYNKAEINNAIKEDRDVELLPKITPHVLRHTACTRMAEAGMDVKTLQYIMGHKEAATTMQIYNHVSEKNIERVVKEVNKADKYMMG